MLYYPFFPSMRRPSRTPSSYTSSPSTASASSSSYRASRTHAKQNPGLALKASTLLARPPLCTHGYPTPPSGAAQSKKEDENERKKARSFFSSSGLRFDFRFSIFDWWFHARKARFSLSLLFSHPFLSSQRIVIRQKTPSYLPLKVWTGPDPPDGASRPSVRPRHTTSRASSLSGNDRTTERPNTPLFFFLVRLIEEDTSSCLR